MPGFTLQKIIKVLYYIYRCFLSGRAKGHNKGELAMANSDVESMACVAALREFAEKLPPELRADLYFHISVFFNVGAMNGALVGALDTGELSSSTMREQNALVEYLGKMGEESRAASATAS